MKNLGDCGKSEKEDTTQPLIICSKLPIETLEKGVKYFQS